MNHNNFYKKIISAFLAIAMIAGVVSAYTVPAHAAINKQINYQGKLTGTSNVAVADGTYAMEFKLYTQASGGSAVWTETLSGADEVQVTNGLFSVMLGSTTPFTGVDFNQTLYLGVNIEADGEMTPRKVIGAVPAAFVADTLDNLSSEQFIRTDAQNSTSTASTFLNVLQSGAGKVAEFFGQASASVLALLSNGNVGVGTSTPYAKLSVAGTVVGQNFVATSTVATSTFPVISLAVVDAGVVARQNDTGVIEYYKPTADTDSARGSAFTAALSEAGEGDTVYLGTGIYDTSSGTNLPFGVSIVGAGREATIISAVDEFSPTLSIFGNNTIAHVTVKNATSSGDYVAVSNNSYSPTSDYGLLTFYNSKFYGYSDGVLLFGKGNFRAVDSYVYGSSDGLAIDASNSSYPVTVDIANSHFVADGNGAALRIGSGISSFYGSAIVSDSTFEHVNGNSSTKALLLAPQSGTTVRLYGNKVIESDSSVHLSGIGSGSIVVGAGNTFNPSKIEGSSVSYDNTAIGNIFVNGSIGIGTTSPYSKLSVAGQVVAQNFVATSSNATSTFAGGVGIGTTTPAAKLGIAGGWFTTATSTGMNGINLTAGCYAVNGTCLTNSSYGNTDVNAYIHASTTIPKAYTANTFTNTNIFNGSVGIGGTPISILTVNGDDVDGVIAVANSNLTSNRGYIGVTGSANQIAAGTNIGDFVLKAYGGGLVLAASGNSDLSVTSGGNVAVGTNLPSRKFTVNDASDTYLSLNAGDIEKWVIGSEGSSADRFAIYNTSLTSYALNITSANNYVGIGTTSPFMRLSVAGSANFDGFVRAGRFVATSSVASTLPYASTTGITVTGTASTTNLTVSSLLNTRIPYATTGGRLIDNSGFTFSGSQLVVDTNTSSGSVNIKNTSAGSNSGFLSVNNTASPFIAGLSSGDFGIKSDFGNLAFSANNGTNAHLFIANSTGNVGVGTTSPSSKLDVYGNIRLSGGARTIDTDSFGALGGTAGGNLTVSAGGGSTSSGGSILVAAGSGSSGGSVTISGGGAAGTGGSVFITSGGGPTSGNISLLPTSSGQIFINSLSGNININPTSANIILATSSANVGIGTTSPYAKLSVAGQIVGSYFTGTSTATSTFGGNLAINGTGTTTSAGGFNISAGCFAVNNVCLTNNTYSNTDVNAYIHASTTIPKTYTANTFTALQTFGNASTTQLSVSNTAYFPGGIWDSNGNVGINTTDVSSRLHVIDGTVAELKFNSGAADLTPTLALGNTDPSGKFGALIAGTSGAGFYFDDAGFFDIVAASKSDYTSNNLGSAGVTLVKLLSTGEFGIGTSSPYAKLSVAGQIVGEYFTATSTTATSTLPNLAVSGRFLLAPVILVKPDGTQIPYGQGATSDSVRGDALVAAVDASTAGDKVLIMGSVYTVSSPLILASSTALVGVGNPTIQSSFTGNPTIVIQNSTTTVSDLKIITSDTGIGKLGAGGVSVTGIEIARVNIQPAGDEACAIVWNNSCLGGVVEHYIKGTIKDSVLYGDNDTTSFGINAPLSSGSSLKLINNDVYGYTDGVLFGGSSGATVEILGGIYTSEIDPITSGGATIYVNGAKARGAVANADLFEDGGNIIAVNVDYTTASVGVQGDQRIPQDLTVSSQILVGEPEGTPSAFTLESVGTFGVSTSGYANNGNRFIVNSSGNVGIGTTSPYAKLSVAGQIVGASFVSTTTATSTFGGGINIATGCFAINNVCLSAGGSYGNTDVNAYIHASTTIPKTYTANTFTALQTFGNASTTQITSTDSAYFATVGGNVGIGTTSPYAKLSVVGEVVGSYFTATTTATSTFSNLKAGGATGIFANSNNGKVAVGAEVYDSTYPFTVNDGLAVQANSGQDWFTVAGGNVIFNSAGGTTRAGGIDLGARFNIAPISDAFPTLAVRGYSGGVSDIMRVSSPSATTGDYFIIKSTGSVGIGTTSPYAKLSVVGEIVAASFIGTTTATSTFGGGINIATGCFAVNGVCVGSGGSLSGGTAGMLSAWTSGSTLTATGTPTFAAFTATSSTATSTIAGALSVGTTTIKDQSLNLGGNLSFGRRAQSASTRFIGYTGTGGAFSNVEGDGTTGIVLNQLANGNTSLQFRTGTWGSTEGAAFTIDSNRDVSVQANKKYGLGDTDGFAWMKFDDVDTYGLGLAAVNLFAGSTNGNTPTFAFVDGEDTNGGANIILPRDGSALGIGQISPSYPIDVYSSNSTAVRIQGSVSSAANWQGRIIAGGQSVAFLMGERNDQAWLGAHDAALSAWSDFYLNPDGGNKLYLGSQDAGGESVEPVLTVTNASGNSARVGIGNNTSPAAKLHVLATSEQLRLGYDASNYLSATVGSAGTVAFDAIGTGANFSFADNVGIGTTSPYANLSISNSTSGTAFAVSSSTVNRNVFKIDSTSGHVAIGYDQNGANNFVDNNDADALTINYHSYNPSAQKTIFSTKNRAGTKTFCIGDLGTIVVNNQSSTCTIDANFPGGNIYGTLKIYNQGATQNAGFEIADRTNSSNGFQFYSSNNIFRMYNRSLTTDAFYVDGATNNFGIATSTPYAKLSVTNTGTAPSFLVEDSASPDSTPFVITATGNVGIGTTTPMSVLAVVGTTTVAGNIVPGQANTYSLGTAELPWKDLYVSSTTIYIDSLPLASINGNLTFNSATLATSSSGRIYSGAFVGTSTATSTFGGGINIASGCFAVNNVCVGGGVGSYGNTDVNAYIHASTTIPKTYTTNTFTALNTFGAGLISQASTTIGNGTATGGLTVSGGATTTGLAYFAGNVGVGVNDSTSLVHVRGAGNDLFRIENTSTNPADKVVALFSGALSSADATPAFSTIGNNSTLGIRQDTADPGNFASVTFYDALGGDAAYFGTRFNTHNGYTNANSDFFIGTAENSAPSIRLLVGANGNVGVGTTSPWAKLSVVGDSPSPEFVIATSSGMTPLFYVNSTTTGAMDYARIGVGTSTLGAAGLRDQLVVSGRIYSTWRQISCESLGASMVSALSADTANFCGSYALDVNTDGRVVLPTASPAFGRLEAGFGSVAAANEAVTVRTALIAARGENPVYETKVKIPSFSTSTMTLFGFYGSNMATATPGTMPANGAFFIATSTNTWIAMTRSSNAFTYTNTGIATSTSFQKLRIEMTSSDTTFLINDTIAAYHTTNIPTAALSPTAMVAIIAPGASINNHVADVQYIRAWIDDPPTAIAGSEAASSSSYVEPSVVLRDLAASEATAGGSISMSYVADKTKVSEEGTIVSFDMAHEFRVRASKGSYDAGIAGVVSTNSTSVYGTEHQDTLRVATAGRAMVKVSTENGPIKIGDYITSSSQEGVGMKATRTGGVIGRALQNLAASSTETMIAVAIEPGRYVEASSMFAFDEGSQDNIANLTHGIDWVRSLRPISFNYKADGSASIGFSPEEVKSISPSLVSMDRDGKPLSVRYELLPAVLVNAVKDLDIRVTRLEALMASSTMGVITDATSTMAVVIEGFKGLGMTIENGVASFKNIFADKVATKEICLDDLCITKEELKLLLENANVDAHQPPIAQDDQNDTETDVSTTTSTTTITVIPVNETASSTSSTSDDVEGADSADETASESEDVGEVVHEEGDSSAENVSEENEEESAPSDQPSESTATETEEGSVSAEAPVDNGS